MYSEKVPTFLKNIKRPWKILAPMVDNSEEAFRILVKNYGCDFGYTEMVNTTVLNRIKFKFEKNKWFSDVSKDRPLVVQICGNDPITMLKSSRKLEPFCDAIDINLGCPQHCARKGMYGAWLMNDQTRIFEIVKTLSNELTIPVFCKIRVFDSIEKSVKYAKMIENAGCSLLTVHGRTIHQKGKNTGFVSLDHIKAIKEALTIPVISNGGILEHKDIEKTLNYTKCDGVMIGEPILYIPTIFSVKEVDPFEISEEYLNICSKYPGSADIKHIRSHLFKFLYEFFTLLPEYRNIFLKKRSIYELIDFVNQFKNTFPNIKFKLKPYLRSNILK
ncbi:DUS1L [Hepatospora eriocheir]|uniref:tRNA-dihydrouridine synthase n=1 Tax=Hepatospora eriocheir TaxID=1081669 RepID=A0A1X0QBT8_9MICR|nr:DUS1L [Hepatospora eriocheir]